MFTKSTTTIIFTTLLTVISTAAGILAMPNPGGFNPTTPSGGITNSCNTGEIQCCQSVHEGSSDIGQVFGGLLGLNIQNIVGSIGLNCVAGNGIGAVSGANCGAHPVCCDRSVNDGLVAISCLPINVQA